MDYRYQKQIVIGLVSLIVLMGGAFVFTSLITGISTYTSPEGVDIEKPGKPAFRNPEILFTDFFEVKKSGTYDAVAYIKNLNLEYGSSDVAYEFNFLNEAGVVFYKLSGTTFILPGESKYVIEPAIKLPAAPADDTPAKVEFIIEDVTWRRLAPFSPGELSLSDTSLKGEEGLSGSRFLGVVNNMSPYNLRNVEVHIVLYQGGKPITAGRTDMQDLLRGSARAFQIMLPHGLPQDVSIDARVESNFFENSNFIRDYAIPS